MFAFLFCGCHRFMSYFALNDSVIGRQLVHFAFGLCRPIGPYKRAKDDKRLKVLRCPERVH